MSLTLQLASEALNFQSSTATVFAPNDNAFIKSGSPPLLQLRHHLSPERLTFEALKTLPCGSRIPSLVPNQSLVVTTSLASDGFISINNVRVHENAVFGDGSVVLYGIDEFINSSFQTVLDPVPASCPGSTTGLKGPTQDEQWDCPVESFGLVAKFLRSRGYSIVATFLDGQLSGFKDQTKLTIFAPVDQAFEDYVRNISDYSLIFRRHVVPRLLSWQDLIGCEVGTKLPTFSRGFMVNVMVSNEGVPVVNDAPVVFQDIYRSDWLVVHGLNGLMKSSTDQELAQDSFSDGYVGDESQGNGEL